MRIAIIAPFHDFGGSEHQILLLLRGLNQQGIEFVFFHLNIRSNELLEELEQIPGCKHVEIRLRSIKNPFLFFLDAHYLAKQLRLHKCELLHCWNYPGHIIGGLASKMARMPCIFSIGGLDPWKKAWHLPFFRLLNRIADVFVFQSETERAIVSHREWIPSKRTQIIPNGVELQRFHAANREEERIKLREEFSISPNIPLVLSVGSLRPIKGHDVLIEAVRRICEMHPDIAFHVLIVGDGPLRNTYEQSTHELPISFAGFRKNIERFFQAADVYCQPSRSEGLPNTVIEAMSCGLPIVATDVGGVVDLVSIENGRLCPPDDVEVLAERISELLENQKAWPLMAECSIQNSNRFSSDTMVDSYISVYRHIQAHRMN